MKPEVLAWFYKRPKLVVLPDGKLLGLYVNKGGSQQQLRAIPSEDTGKTWFPFPWTKVDGVAASLWSIAKANCRCSC